MFNIFKKVPEKEIETHSYSQFNDDLYKYKFKLVLIGDCSVGKSSILIRFSEDRFMNNYNPTIGVDFASKILDIGTKVKLLVWDTAGQERFRTITKNYYRGADAHLLIFDMTDPSSFENLKYWMKEIKEYTDFQNIFLIGTKNDLMTNTFINPSFIQKFIEENKIINYFEISSKTNKNIDNTFNEIAKYLTNQKMKDDIEKAKNINVRTVPVVNYKNCC